MKTVTTVYSVQSSNNKKRSRTYRGRTAAEKIALWMNRAAGEGTSEAAESFTRVNRTLRLLQRIEDLRSKAEGIDVFKESPPQFKPEESEVLQLMMDLLAGTEAKEVAQQFSRYRFTLEFSWFDANRLLHPRPSGYATDIEFGGDYPLGWEPYHESEVVWDIIELARESRVWTLRFCDQCAKVYFAKRTDARFCSDVCKQRFHAASPETQVKKARAMRALRESEKKRQQAAKRRVGVTGRQ